MRVYNFKAWKIFKVTNVTAKNRQFMNEGSCSYNGITKFYFLILLSSIVFV